ncbi:MAG: amidohydrolase family protein [Kiritimatiellaeota bacterium]|nr:amidohydrolase family protein [Kiritimatiellota bacterium]
MLIDIHVHCCRARDPRLTRPNDSRYPTPGELIAAMDAHGIDKALCMGTVSPACRYTVVPPEELLEIAAEHPDRLIPCCPVDPRWLTNSPKADFRPMLSAYKELGCRCIGEYIPNLPLDDPMNLNLFAQAAELGLPVTIHIAPRLGGCYGLVDEPGLPRLENVLRAFPELVLLGHSQPFWAEIAIMDDPESQRAGYPNGPVRPGRLVRLFREYPNLYGDLSAGSGFNAVSRDPEFGYAFLHEFQDRLLFGTDIANVPQELPIVGWFREAREQGWITPETHEKIAWRNADRLLGLGLDSD